ncbi:MAG: uracil-DNA glycosylase [Chloroflexi bacterium]|nr:uracil-DNA glycosylase [Chloroflexota bacterium]
MGTVVPGEGPPNATVMLIGQNPGREEARQGRPFIGRSGKYLDRVLAENGIDRKELYITSVVKETTPGNRAPTTAEIERWLPHLVDEIKWIRPRIIVLMGKVASNVPRLEDIEYIETCHPAAAMRFPKMRREFEQAIAELREFLAQPKNKTGEEPLKGSSPAR